MPETNIPNDEQLLAFTREQHGILAAATFMCVLRVGGAAASWVRQNLAREIRIVAYRESAERANAADD